MPAAPSRRPGSAPAARPPGLRRAKTCPQIVQLLPKNSMRPGELTAPCHRAASIFSGHQTTVPSRPAPPCWRYPPSARDAAHRISRGPGSQTRSSPVLSPIPVTGTKASWTPCHPAQITLFGAVARLADHSGETEQIAGMRALAATVGPSLSVKASWGRHLGPVMG